MSADDAATAAAATGDAPDPAARAAALFDAALDVPLSESRLRGIERAGALAPDQLARAAELIGGPLPTALWRSFLQRVLLFLAAGHIVAGLFVLLVEVWEDLGPAGSVALTVLVAAAPAIAALRAGPATRSGGVLLTSSAVLCGAVVAVAQLAYPLPLSDWFQPALVTVLAVPFAMAARADYAWLVPLAALHITAAALLHDAGDYDEISMWLLTSGLGAFAWFGWTVLARGVPWMRGRLVPGVEAVVALTGATVVAANFAFAGWALDVEVAQGVPATATLLFAAVWLTRRALAQRRDVLLAVLAIVACAIVAAVGVARALEQVLDATFAFAIAGLGLVAVTAGAVWLLRSAVHERGAP